MGRVTSAVKGRRAPAVQSIGYRDDSDRLAIPSHLPRPQVDNSSQPDQETRLLECLAVAMQRRRPSTAIAEL